MQSIIKILLVFQTILKQILLPQRHLTNQGITILKRQKEYNNIVECTVKLWKLMNFGKKGQLVLISTVLVSKFIYADSSLLCQLLQVLYPCITYLHLSKAVCHQKRTCVSHISDIFSRGRNKDQFAWKLRSAWNELRP